MAEGQRKPNRKTGDGLDGDFGPGFDPAPDAQNGAEGPARSGGSEGPARERFGAGFAGIPCGKGGCVLKPVGDLVTRFALELAGRGHADSAQRAATSGIELLRALRDFLDQEIALAERAAEARQTPGRYTKIPVE